MPFLSIVITAVHDAPCRALCGHVRRVPSQVLAALRWRRWAAPPGVHRRECFGCMRMSRVRPRCAPVPCTSRRCTLVWLLCPRPDAFQPDQRWLRVLAGAGGWRAAAGCAGRSMAHATAGLPRHSPSEAVPRVVAATGSTTGALSVLRCRDYRDSARGLPMRVGKSRVFGQPYPSARVTGPLTAALTTAASPQQGGGAPTACCSYGCLHVCRTA